jgi:hypothetical protein
MITLDGFQLFPVIAAHPHLFASSRDLIHGTAEKVVLAAVTDPTLDLPGAKALFAALGEAGFTLALDHLGGNKLKNVLRRVDANFKPPATFGEAAYRERILGVVRGTTPVAPPTAKAGKSTAEGGRKRSKAAPAAPSPPEFSRSAGAKPRR